MTLRSAIALTTACLCMSLGPAACDSSADTSGSGAADGEQTDARVAASDTSGDAGALTGTDGTQTGPQDAAGADATSGGGDDTGAQDSSGTGGSEDGAMAPDDVPTGPGDDADGDPTGALPPLPEVQPLEVPEGGFGIGYSRLSVTYTPATFDEPRTLEVAVWYPTTDTEGTPTSYLDFIARPGVLTDATVAGAALPTVVFSHGNNGIETQSWYFQEALAARGWLVIAPRHTSNSFLDFSQALFPVMWIWRPLDISATLDAFQGFAGDHRFAGVMSEDIVAAGHSFGGYTTLAVGGATLDVVAVDLACAADPSACGDLWTDDRRDLAQAGFGDPRVDGLVAMAPWRVGGIVGTDGTASVALPTLLLTASLDETTTNAEDGDPIWSGLEHGDNRRLDLTTGGHMTFANACELGLPAGDGCGPGFIPSEDAFQIIDEYSFAFIDQHILGDDHAGLLDGIDPPPPVGTTLTVPAE